MMRAESNQDPQISVHSFNPSQLQRSVIKSPRQKQKLIGRVSGEMQRVYTRKKPLNLKGVKKSEARIKEGTSGCFEESVPRVGSREFPQAPTSVRD